MQLFYICVCLLLHYFYPEGATLEGRGVRETESGKSFWHLYIKLLLLYCLKHSLFYYKTEMDEIIYMYMQLCYRRNRQKLSQVSCFATVDYLNLLLFHFGCIHESFLKLRNSMARRGIL